MSYVFLPLQMQIKIRACWTLLIGHSDQHMLGRQTDLKRHSAMSVCLVLRNSEHSRRKTPAAESPRHVLRLPAWAGHAELGKKEATLNITELLAISGNIQARSLLHLCLDPLTDKRQPEVTVSCRLSLSSLFLTVLVADCVCPNHSDDFWSSMNWWISVRQNITELHNGKFAEHPHPLLSPAPGISNVSIANIWKKNHYLVISITLLIFLEWSYMHNWQNS